MDGASRPPESKGAEGQPPERRQGFVAQKARQFVALLVRLFFRRVVTLGVEALPRDRGILLVAWHPNGLVDPALILTSMPGPLVLGARHGLFRWPLLGLLMRALGTVPIYRRSDTS
ncbi:MAG TPA: hypothetical protein DIU15_07175, partial [Deltaproteobacteria bacterium]|nr:hypothetical protein [Deltaproteobacteria bacterium]